MILRHSTVKWAELEVIDLEKAKTVEGRAELVIKARDAMHNQGFFYVVNHGLEKAQASIYLNRLGPWTYTSVLICCLVNDRWNEFSISPLYPSKVSLLRR